MRITTQGNPCNEYSEWVCSVVHRLFIVNCYLLHVPRLPSQPASNVGGLVGNGFVENRGLVIH